MLLEILFKTRSGQNEGMGDVTSSIALAEEFRKEGHKVLFFINNNKSGWDFLSLNQFEYKIVEKSTGIERRLDGQLNDIAILNQLNTPEEEAIIFRKHSKILVTMDEAGNSAKLADLRFNIFCPTDDAITDLEFIPLPSVLQEKHNIPKVIRERVQNILILQGGSDPNGFTPKIMRALDKIPSDIDIDVVIGPNFSHHNELEVTLNRSQRKFNIIKGKNDLSDIMLRADLAISAGGNTCFELACLGIPTIIVCGVLLEVVPAKRLEKAGIVINLGFGSDVAEYQIYQAVTNLINQVNLRREMSDKGKSSIDGLGSQRMVKKIISKYYEKCNAPIIR